MPCHFCNSTCFSLLFFSVKKRNVKVSISLDILVGTLLHLISSTVQKKLCRTWWQKHYQLVVMAIVVTLLVGLSASGAWLLWRRRQQTLNAYKPVDMIVPEQELQPLWWISFRTHSFIFTRVRGPPSYTRRPFTPISSMLPAYLFRDNAFFSLAIRELLRFGKENDLRITVFGHHFGSL